MSLLFSALLLACKPSESTSKIQAVAESERIDWDSKIESGEVGFFNPKGDTLIGVDVAPRTRGDKTFRPLIGMSLECRDYLVENGTQLAKLEFLVNEQGESSHFYLLQSAGICDRDALRYFKNQTLVAAKKDDRNKAVLVHFDVRFMYMTTNE